jgi:ribosomal protein S18 acetylase RimI-like enzyme
MANRVERAAAADIPRLVDSMEAFYREAAYPLDRRWAAKSFAALVGNPALGAAWLLWRDGNAAGYVVLTVRFSMEYGGRDAFIDDLFVRPEHRRHGVGTAALTELIAECRRRGVLALHVEVGHDNRAANALYQKFGLGLRTDQRQMRTVEFA